MVRQRLTPQPSRLLKRHRAPALPLLKPSSCSAFSWALYTRLQAYIACEMWAPPSPSHLSRTVCRLMATPSSSSQAQYAAISMHPLSAQRILSYWRPFRKGGFRRPVAMLYGVILPAV